LSFNIFSGREVTYDITRKELEKQPKYNSLMEEARG